MPFRTVPETEIRYALLAFDKNGVERADDPDGRSGLLSARLLEQLAAEPVTSIFLFSHGWKGDVPAAIEQYDRWIKALENMPTDQAHMQDRLPGLKSLHIGLHWPSQPWGDEELGPVGVSFAPVGPAMDLLLANYIERLGDTPVIRKALETIFEEARTHADADTLTPSARQAYLDLDAALSLGSAGVGGDAGSDRLPFDPDQAMEAASNPAVDFGGFGLGNMLAPLRQLSFWTMKKRAQIIGEGGMHTFLRQLQQAAPHARIHLMGHSFGCVVMSAMLGGPLGDAPLPRPVDSCVLVQGAMSLWAYCPDIPYQPGTPGYCHRIISTGKVRGPMITTRSRFDRAVGTLYPLAAGVAGQVAFAPGELPEYGAIGSFGLQGITAAIDQAMLPQDQGYDFQSGKVYNLESSQFICKGEGISGAHSDIDGPEVAHVIWQAALV